MSQYAVFATLSDSRRVRMSDWCSWDYAQAWWQGIDDERRNSGGLVVKTGRFRHREGPVTIQVIEVRSQDDPAYRDSPTIAFSFRRMSKHGYTTSKAAMKAWGKENGYEGSSGGWIYRDGQPYTQGWESMDHLAKPVYVNGRYHYTDLTAPLIEVPTAAEYLLQSLL